MSTPSHDRVSLIDGEPMVQQVADYLRESIYSGELRPGSALRQEAIASRLGVSRLPVREALRQLESEGLVVARPNSGAKVALLDFAEYADIYKVRERVEPLVLAESIPSMTDEQKEETGRLLRELETLIDDPPAFLATDRKFHLSCYAGASPFLIKTVEGFWNTTQRHRRLLLATYSAVDYEWTNWEHRLIYDCILTGNARAGEDVIRLHIERTRLHLGSHRELFDR
jgi:Transcriptional regulators